MQAAGQSAAVDDTGKSQGLLARFLGAFGIRGDSLLHCCHTEPPVLDNIDRLRDIFKKVTHDPSANTDQSLFARAKPLELCAWTQKMLAALHFECDTSSTQSVNNMSALTTHFQIIKTFYASAKHVKLNEHKNFARFIDAIQVYEVVIALAFEVVRERPQALQRIGDELEAATAQIVRYATCCCLAFASGGCFATYAYRALCRQFDTILVAFDQKIGDLGVARIAEFVAGVGECLCRFVRVDLSASDKITRIFHIFESFMARLHQAKRNRRATRKQQRRANDKSDKSGEVDVNAIGYKAASKSQKQRTASSGSISMTLSQSVVDNFNRATADNDYDDGDDDDDDNDDFEEKLTHRDKKWGLMSLTQRLQNKAHVFETRAPAVRNLTLAFERFYASLERCESSFCQLFDALDKHPAAAASTAASTSNAASQLAATVAHLEASTACKHSNKHPEVSAERSTIALLFYKHTHWTRVDSERAAHEATPSTMPTSATTTNTATANIIARSAQSQDDVRHVGRVLQQLEMILCYLILRFKNEEDLIYPLAGHIDECARIVSKYSGLGLVYRLVCGPAYLGQVRVVFARILDLFDDEDDDDETTTVTTPTTVARRRLSFNSPHYMLAEFKARYGELIYMLLVSLADNEQDCIRQRVEQIVPTAEALEGQTEATVNRATYTQPVFKLGSES